MIAPNEFYQVAAATVLNLAVPFSTPMKVLRIQNDNAAPGDSVFLTLGSLVATAESIEVKAGELFQVDLPSPTEGIGLITDPASGVYASLETALVGNNNDLVFTALALGQLGNGVTIRYVDPAQETALESVAVIGQAITVTLRSVSSVLSTAAQVKAAIEASEAASALVSVALAGGNDGTGAVTALAQTPLAGGDGDEASVRVAAWS